jgi:hypothetical protein
MSLLIIGNRCDLNCTTMHSGESFSQLDRVFSTAAGRHPDYVPQRLRHRRTEHPLQMIQL